MKTPQQSYPALANALGVQNIYLKREDLHKYGSHKGRSIPQMIKYYFKYDNIVDFCISSSGNAALASILAINSHNKNNPENMLNLQVLVGMKIPSKKLERLHKEIKDKKIEIKQVEKPKQTAFQLDKENKAKNLRQSTDPLALEGYTELAKELKKIPNLKAVFIPTSSGTTAQALGTKFSKLTNTIEVHIVQTTFCHPIAEEFHPERKKNADSLAGAIVDNVAHRKKEVIKVIKSTNGSGWIADNNDITNAIDLVKRTTKIVISPNSALSIVGLQKALQSGWLVDGVVACLITGE
ncbi:MAG: hypothetical protein COX81_02985 [Candidatus Magasanikbacteria bacterium CG_4_10_14_0_2_um_filter_37_12]|uniref:Tryptophan synthase beta chain-like PALP domain-containing protein n=1 Tax=Candidatus Magasanikbacteria bacterium CG_4_10_14_0_2_um_filter_37_12 TaxID=1974637 RepID=A0A2M7V7C1_9BACT|nr:MAG: hypothetical protein COX81_02985 [Candidatus Magasanikbacteria bacterium CG_4_10_14_0_2_um_filter_37_12]